MSTKKETKTSQSSPLENITGKCPYDINLKHSAERRETKKNTSKS